MKARQLTLEEFKKEWYNYWIYKTSYYCPQCGRGHEYRERRYDPKPTKWEDRHKEIESWDYCGI